MAAKKGRALLKELSSTAKLLKNDDSFDLTLLTTRTSPFLKLYSLITDLQFSQAIKNTPKDSPPDFNTFAKWLLSNGCQSNVSFASSLPEGNGAIANLDIKTGDLILEVPMKLMLTTKSALETASGKIISKEPALQQLPSLCLALHLLYEKFNPKSFWAPYIQILPKHVPMALYLTLEELRQLEGSPRQSECLKLITNTSMQYAFLFDILQHHERGGH